MNKPLTLLDCTIRDGSYAIDYQWTTQHTRAICSALENAGVQFIEIGHGVGLNGSHPQRGVAAATDVEYCDAAASVLTRARFGAFIIPGIGREEDIKAAHEHGLGFLRIGTNVTEVAQARPFIEYAKSLGLYVSYNAMKSYLLSPEEYAETVRVVEQWGADVVAVVDSAGCMLPDEVSAYVRETCAAVSIPVGFHGHNNLLMANANSLAAYRAGAAIVDCTLQGIGRGGGNAQTEALVAICNKLDVPTGIDIYGVLAAGEEFVRPLMADGGGSTSLDVAIGIGGFHSSFLSRLQGVVQRIPVDPKRLIIALGDVDRLDPSVETMERVASGLVQHVEA